MDLQAIESIHLRNGSGGGDPRKGLCVMEMVDYFNGADFVTDRPECACPTLTAFAIRVNDRARSDADRDTLKEIVPLISGTRSETHKKARAEFIVRAVAHRMVAPLFDLAQQPEMADKIRTSISMKDIRDTMCEAKKTAAAADAAYAAAAAADAAAVNVRRWFWFLSRQILIEAIVIGPNGGLDAQVFAERAETLRRVLSA